MKRIVGVILILVALLLFLGVYIYLFKKGSYKGDFLGLLIDSFDFLIIIGALILLGIVLLSEKT